MAPKLVFFISTFYKKKVSEMMQNSFEVYLNYLYNDLSASKFAILSSNHYIKINGTSIKIDIRLSDTKKEVYVEWKDIIQNILDSKLSIIEIHCDEKTLLTFAIVCTIGSLEIPQIATFFLEKYKNFDGAIALGIIKKGGTDHNHYVATECIRGINDVAMKYKIPFTNGVIVANTDELIDDRVSKNGINIGGQVTATCIDVITLKQKIDNN
jgi:6,7-dimethyl-8-ribityllumazine synthase